MQDAVKKCKCCRELKPLELFHKSKKAADGHKAECKECRSLAAKQYRTSNHTELLEKERIKRETRPEEIAAAQARYQEKHKDRIRQNARDWKKNNPDKLKAERSRYYTQHSERMNAYGKQWRQVNKARCNAWTAEYRAKKANATVPWADMDKIAVFYAKAKRLSIWMEEEYHVDHIVPITSKYVCGLHNEFNLQLLTKTENLQKLNSWWPDMP